MRRRDDKLALELIAVLDSVKSKVVEVCEIYDKKLVPRILTDELVDSDVTITTLVRGKQASMDISGRPGQTLNFIQGLLQHMVCHAVLS